MKCLVAGYYPGTDTIVVGTECKQPVFRTYVSGCKHEHVDRGAICKTHLNSLYGVTMVCGACESVDGHRCVMRVEYGTIDSSIIEPLIKRET